MTREPRGAWGCVESPEDCSHASQLRQQRLQLQPLSSPRQTGRLPLPPCNPPAHSRGREGRGRWPVQGAEERGSGWWQEPPVTLTTWSLRLSCTCWRGPCSCTHSPKAPFPLCSQRGPCHRLPWVPTPRSFLGSQEENGRQRTLVSQRKGWTFVHGRRKVGGTACRGCWEAAIRAREGSGREKQRRKNSKREEEARPAQKTLPHRLGHCPGC